MTLKRPSIIISFILLIGAITAHAQTNDALDPQKAPPNYLESIDNHIKALPYLVQTTVEPILNFSTKLLFAKVPDLGVTIASQAMLASTEQYAQTAPMGGENNTPGLINSISPIITAPYVGNVWLKIGGGAAATDFDLENMFRGAINPKFTPDIGNYYALMPSALGGSINNNSFTITASSIFGDQPYTNAQQLANAKLFLAFASGVATAKDQPPLNKYNDAIQAAMKKAGPNAQLPDVVYNIEGLRDYAMNYYTMAAIQSFDSYTLSQIYANNLVNPAAQPKAITDFPAGQAITANALEDFIHTREASNPDWYRKMAIASPYAVLREILFLEAGNFMTQRRIEKTDERIAAALTMQNTLLMTMVSGSAGVMQKAQEQISKSKADVEKITGQQIPSS